jgi:hypothetical protein
MAKIILATEGVVLREIPLVKERMMIGRNRASDILIDDPAVSAEHAVIVTVGGDSFLEDLNSTNGTQVNGQPVRKHFLQIGDMVELVGYCLRYERVDAKSQESLTQDPAIQNSHESDRSNATALLKVIDGPKVGQEVMLEKAFTTIGGSEGQIIAISRQSHEYYLAVVAGGESLSVNGNSIGSKLIEIRNGDIIQLLGTHVQFVATSE